MPTQEIPRDEWKTFLDTFSRQHEGWLATLEVLGTDIGAQQEALAICHLRASPPQRKIVRLRQLRSAWARLRKIM
ncbi:hypothetical protein BH20ACI3_BH20ACI3_19140 [soil metagenome]